MLTKLQKTKTKKSHHHFPVYVLLNTTNTSVLRHSLLFMPIADQSNTWWLILVAPFFLLQRFTLVFVLTIYSMESQLLLRITGQYLNNSQNQRQAVVFTIGFLRPCYSTGQGWGPDSLLLRGNCNMQHFPNLFDNGNLFSKLSNILLDSIGLVF